MTAFAADQLAGLTAGPTPFPRRLSPAATRSGGRARMLLGQARSELIKALRAPDFVAPVVILPVVLYALFGSPAMGEILPNGIDLGPLVTASFTAYGVLGIALFTFGEGLATERGQGWLRLVRATPLPGSVFLLGKLAAAIALTAIFLLIMGVVSALIGAGLTFADWALLVPVAIFGGIVLAPVGSLLGLLVRPNAGGAVSLLLYLPLSYASGMWTPVESLPEPVQAISPFMPTYHLAELAQAAVGVGTAGALGQIAWLAGTFVVFAGLAAWAYRRVAGRQFA